MALGIISRAIVRGTVGVIVGTTVLCSPAFAQWNNSGGRSSPGTTDRRINNNKGGSNNYYNGGSNNYNNNGSNNNKNKNNQAVGEAIIGGLILGAAINEALQPPRRPDYIPPRPSNYYPPKPQYIPSRPQYIESQPQYIESRPVERIISSQPVETTVSSAPVAPPKPNVVKSTPKSNDSLKSLTGSLAVADGSAADPLLAVATQESVQDVTDAVTEYVDENGSPEMQEAWKKVVASGSSPAEISKWWKKYGPSIDDPAIKALGPIHTGMSKLVQDLEDGLLSATGKKAAIDKLAELVAELPADDPLRDEIAADLVQMRQFQKLGELLGLASVAPDPIVPILQGTQAMGMPMPVISEVIGIPLREFPVADAEPLATSVTIYIVNQSTNTQSVNCTIGGGQIEMKPGTAKPLTASSSVVFDPGNGTRRSVPVTAGTWGWKIEDGLWNLVKVTPQIVIDNTGFKGVFHYTINGKQASVAAGETVEHSHSMPIEISFDRGNGTGTASKLLTFGTYAVGVDLSSRGIEMFRTDIPSAPVSTAMETATTAAGAGASEAKSKAGNNRVREALEAAEKQKELTKLLRSLDQPKP